jgi:L-fuconolactonase
MVVVDIHCHATPYWYEPIEILMTQMDLNGVDKAVMIQIAGWFDNTYPLECMARYPGRLSVVVVVDTAQSDAPDRLEEWTQQGAEGIRLRPNTRSPGSDSLAIWRKASDLGVPVSCAGTLGQFADPEFEAVIQEVPGLTIIIEHLAGVGRESGDEDAESSYRRVLGLSKYANTYMKVPGLGEIAKRAMPVKTPFPFDDAPPLIELAIGAFGGDRLMWGSDFPPSAGREGYANTLKLPMDNVSFPSQVAKDMIFGGTAASIWKFGE